MGLTHPDTILNFHWSGSHNFGIEITCPESRMQSRREKDNEQWNVKIVSYFLNAIIVQVFGFIQRENGLRSRKWKMTQQRKINPIPLPQTHWCNQFSYTTPVIKTLAYIKIKQRKKCTLIAFFKPTKIHDPSLIKELNSVSNLYDNPISEQFH